MNFLLDIPDSVFTEMKYNQDFSSKISNTLLLSGRININPLIDYTFTEIISSDAFS